MDIQVGDRVTTKQDNKSYVEIIIGENDAERIIESIQKNRLELIKIERPKWEVVEEKKELLTEEEREFLKVMIKYYKVVKVVFFTSGLNLYDKNDYLLNCPDYPQNMKFEGLERDKEYTLKELGLEE